MTESIGTIRASEILRVTPERVRQMTREGLIAHTVGIGRTWLYRERDIIALRDQRAAAMALRHTPVRVVSFPGRPRSPGSHYISAADESVEWPDDAA